MRNGPYELIVAPQEYLGRRYRGRYCYEHRFIWWLKTGEILKSGEILHHKNGNKRDNRFKNLAKTTPIRHGKGHAVYAKEIEITCPWCGNKKKISERSYRARKKANRMGLLFCNRSCATRYQFHKYVPR